MASAKDVSRPTHKVIEAAWRAEAARPFGALARFGRDVDQTEDLAQEALVGLWSAGRRPGYPATPAPG